MRQEEEIAKNAICDWVYHVTGCFPINIQSEPNGESRVPDYLFEFENWKAHLEITLSGHGFILFDGSSKEIADWQRDRIQYESSTGNFLERHYNQANDDWINPKDTIIVAILSPIPLENRGKLGKKYSKHLSKCI